MERVACSQFVAATAGPLGFSPATLLSQRPGFGSVLTTVTLTAPAEGLSTTMIAPGQSSTRRHDVSAPPSNAVGRPPGWLMPISRPPDCRTRNSICSSLRRGQFGEPKLLLPAFACERHRVHRRVHGPHAGERLGFEPQDPPHFIRRKAGEGFRRKRRAFESRSHRPKSRPGPADACSGAARLPPGTANRRRPNDALR